MHGQQNTKNHIRGLVKGSAPEIPINQLSKLDYNLVTAARDKDKMTDRPSAAKGTCTWCFQEVENSLHFS